MASMSYFDSDMSNFGGNLYLRVRARSHTIYRAQVGCSIFQPAKFQQTIAHHIVLFATGTTVQ
jgi:hypothetical protein